MPLTFVMWATDAGPTSMTYAVTADDATVCAIAGQNGVKRQNGVRRRRAVRGRRVEWGGAPGGIAPYA